MKSSPYKLYTWINDSKTKHRQKTFKILTLEESKKYKWKSEKVKKWKIADISPKIFLIDL
jgi:hypothetical protein